MSREIPAVESPFDFLTDFKRWIRFKTLVYGYGESPERAEAYASGALGVTIMQCDLLGDECFYIRKSRSGGSLIGTAGEPLKTGDLVFKGADGKLRKIPPPPDPPQREDHFYFSVAPPSTLDIDVAPTEYKTIVCRGLKIDKTKGVYRECYADETPDAFSMVNE